MGITETAAGADNGAHDDQANLELWDVVAAVPDPEMPPLTIADLGILRSIDVSDAEGADQLEVTVRVTPTYSGCPAVEYIESQIVEAVVDAGYDRSRVRIDRVLSPAWSTDWITEEGKAKLAASGISPPRPVAATEPGTTTVEIRRRAITCPRCGSTNTELVSRFGSTACKAHYRCGDCAEPFDHVKEL